MLTNFHALIHWGLFEVGVITAIFHMGKQTKRWKATAQGQRAVKTVFGVGGGNWRLYEPAHSRIRNQSAQTKDINSVFPQKINQMANDTDEKVLGHTGH